MVRALTLIRPWAWAIVHGLKRIENRGWRPPRAAIGERILIHAGAKWDRDSVDDVAELMGLDVLPSAASDQGIIGRARVVGCLEEGLGRAPAGQEDWFSGPFGWVLSDVEALPAPIPCKGMLGLWAAPEAVVMQLPAGWQR